MFIAGPRKISTALSFASLPNALPTFLIKSTFQVLASKVPMGKAVEKYLFGSFGRVGLMRTPAGPSDKIIAGIPRRGIA